MKELLYIDGQLVDLGDDVNITLNYKSNMLTDLSKIVGNNSYTIKLPKTMRNLGIIGFSDIPSAVTSFPRSKHDCRYFRNGVEIIADGKAVLMSVGERIEIVITWGNTSGFFGLVQDNRNLDDFEEITDSVTWLAGRTPDVYSGYNKILFSDMELGLDGHSTDMAALHPSVRADYIFGLIKAKYGLDVVFPEDKEAFINSLLVPLLTRNGGYANRIKSKGTVLKEADNETLVKNGGSFDGFFEVSMANNIVISIKALVDCRVVITPSFESLFIGASVMYGTDSVLENVKYFPYDVEMIGDFPLYKYSKPVDIDLAAGDIFRVAFPLATNPSNDDAVAYTFGAQPREIQIGDVFPIVENLPGIKVIDFLKTVASLAGLFAVPSGDGGVLRFVSFDELSDKTKAVDWSDRLLPYDHTNKPRNISYTLDDFAQNNRLKWREDDTVATWADGNIVVGDKTLEYERDAVELPFAPTDGMQKASIKLYEFNDDGEPELQDVEPRLLVETNVGGFSTASFEALHWSKLIANYYKTYQNAVKSPVLLVENIRLDELSLRDFDVSKPVYLRQYGKYYAVVEMKAPNTGVCECKLLQLED